MAQEANKRMAVRVVLNDIVYIVDGQGLHKTYINSIVARQWFDTNGNIVQQITYGVPEDEIGSGVTNKFVLDDFGRIIFTSISSAQKKFESISKYQKDNINGGEDESITSSSGESYITRGSITGIGTGEEAVVDKTTVKTSNDPCGYCNNDCFNCNQYELCEKNEKKPKSINTGTGKSSLSGYIKIQEEEDIPTVPPKVITTNNINYYGNGYTYYDTTGTVVSSESGDLEDATTFINNEGKKANGDIIRVMYKDNNGKLVFRLGDNLEKGNYVYEDGSLVPVGTNILRKMEYVGNVTTGKSNIPSSSSVTEDTEDIDVVDNL